MTNQVQKLEGQQVTTGNPVSKFDGFKDRLSGKKRSIEKVLPSHISYEKFQSVVLTACMQNPELLTANSASMMLACVKSATDGLLPDAREAALVIFNKKQGNDWIKSVQYMPMYAGILKKVRQSEELASIQTQVVYTKDNFEHKLGDDDSIVHSVVDGNDRGEFKAVYCIAKLKDGTIMREVMYKSEVEKVRKTSKSGCDKKTGDPKGIWAQWYEEMAKKTVFRRLAKWLPQSIDKQGNEIRLFDNDDSMDIIGEYEEEAGVDKSAIEEQPDLKKAIEESPSKVEEKQEAKEEALPEPEKPAKNKTEAAEETPPKNEPEEPKTSLQIESEIRAVVSSATDREDLIETLNNEFKEGLDKMKEKYAGQHKRLDAFIESKLKELE